MDRFCRTLLAVAASSGVAAFGEAPAEREFRLPAVPHSYSAPNLPPHFEPRWVAALDTTPADNPTTDAGATLGRVLFYDTRLSASDTVSCGSCHIQKHAFAEPLRVSVGHEGRKGDRNAMSLVELRFTRAGFFWDERAESLEEAVGLPVESRIEMAGPGAELTTRIAADGRYAPLFDEAFGSGSVTEERVRKALAQFIRAMVSCDSKYDRAAAGARTVRDDFPNFTPEENRGKRLFLENCNLCHHIGEGEHVAFFGMFRSLSNGLDADLNVPDAGRGDVTLNPSEVGLFKASSLRNVEVTAPYMHDGRFDTLDEVVGHYSTGVERHPNIGGIARLNLAAEDRAALVAFLKTLTDETFLNDPKFSDPWSPVARLRPVALDGPEPVSPGRPTGRDHGAGLAAGEARAWLDGLDADRDSTLTPSELEPLISRLVDTRVAVLSTERLPRGRVPGRQAEPAAGDGRLGDFDGDGEVSDAEAEAFETFERLIELGEGHPLRRAVRIDRFLDRYELTDERFTAAHRLLTETRVTLADRTREADARLMAEFERAAGADAVAAFQTIVVERQLTAVRSRIATGDDRRGDAVRQVMAFDADGDGRLSGDETGRLAVALDRLPGGLGQPAPVAIDVDQFRRRLAGYGRATDGSVAVADLPERLNGLIAAGDADRDGRLSADELTDYVRTTAFGHLLEEGVYIGGGFADTPRRHADSIAEIGLDSRTRTRVDELFAEHARELDRLVSATKDEAFTAFRETVGNRTPVVSDR